MAVTGIVLSVLWLVAFIGLGLWINGNTAHRNDAGQIDQAGSIAFADIRDGDCLGVSGMRIEGVDGPITSDDPHLKGVPCADSHNAQALHIAVLSGSSYPGEAAIREQTDQACASAYASFTEPGYRSVTLYPNESSWDASDAHRAVCLVVQTDLRPSQGSVVR
jgi:hypothetical protein